MMGNIFVSTVVYPLEASTNGEKLSQNLTNFTDDNMHSNTSMTGEPPDKTLLYVILGYAMVLIISTIILNSLLYFTILYLNRRRLKPAHVFILNVATVDVCITIIYTPLLTVNLLNHNCNHGYCAVLMSLEKALFAGEMWAVALVSGDRYLYVVKHSQYKAKMTMRRAFISVMGMWITIITFGCISSLLTICTEQSTGKCLCHITHFNFGFFKLMYTAVYITLCLILPVTCLLVFYGFVMREAYRHSASSSKIPFKTCSKQESSFPNSLSTITGESSEFRTLSKYAICQVKAIRILALLLCVHFICSLPYFIKNLISASSQQHPSFHNADTNGLIALLMASNCIFNPLFYAFTNKKLRMSFLSWACKHSAQTIPEI
jgi:hypothetical protein